MTEWINQLTHWLGQHPDSLLIAILLGAWVESMVLIGVLVPAVALLFAAAALAGTAEIPLHLCLLTAAAGAATGDILSFLLGRYAHPWLLLRWPFNRHKPWIDKGERFFSRYGLFAVIVGRFIGPIRPIIPFIAGMFSMRPSIFIPIDLITSGLWALVYIVPGYYLGSSATALSDIRLMQHPALIATLTLAAATVLLMLLFGIHWRFRPEATNKQPPLWGIYGVLALTGTIGLALLVNFSQIHTAIDEAITPWLHSQQSEWLTPWIIALTTMGDGASLWLPSGIFFAWLAFTRQYQLAAGWITTSVAVAASAHFLKIGLALPRPELLTYSLPTFTFPSGHSSNFAVFITLLTGLSAQRIRYVRRWLLYAPAATLMLIMAFSRLYLGVHWLTDVIGGLLLGSGTAALMLALSKRQQLKITAPPLSLWLLLASASALCIYLRFPANLSLYLS